MPIYYLQILAVPSSEVAHLNHIEKATAHCWIEGNDQTEAEDLARFKVAQAGWTNLTLQLGPILVTEADFAGKDLGTQHYANASANGMSFAYIAVVKAGRKDIQFGVPVQLPSLEDVDLAKFIQQQATLRETGRCYHRDRRRCNEIIYAHSIQRNGALNKIAEAGEATVPSFRYGDVKKNKGRLSFRTQNIASFSIFRGFCKRHDNALFEPIDNSPFANRAEQAMLYGYRSLCRELFLKENSVSLYREELSRHRGSAAAARLYRLSLRSAEAGAKALRHQKTAYDMSMRKKRFADARFVVFGPKQDPNAVFSGTFAPDYDFLGRPSQPCRSTGRPRFDYLSLSFVPTSTGWGYMLSWHAVSDKTCYPFIESLREAVANKLDPGDLLFRLLVITCENIAYRPSWIGQLPKEKQKAILSGLMIGATPFGAPDKGKLMAGLTGISGWRFDTVFDSRRP